MNISPDQVQFELLQDFAVLTESIRLATSIGKASEAVSLLPKIEKIISELGSPYFFRSYKITKSSLVNCLVDRYSTPSVLKAARQEDIEFLRYAASNGNINAANYLVTAARCRFYPDIVPESDQLIWLNKLSSTADPHAHLDLGEIFDEGRSFQTSIPDRATDHYRAAYQIFLIRTIIGNAPRSSCYFLGKITACGAAPHFDHQGHDYISQNSIQAAFWYRKALDEDLGIGGILDIPSTKTKPLLPMSALAMIALAEILEISSKETSKHLLLARYRWAARSNEPYALFKYANFLGRLYANEYSIARRLCVYRRAARKGDEESAFNFAKLQYNKCVPEFPDRPKLVQFNTTIFTELEKILTNGTAILVRGLYRLLLSGETNSALAVDDFKTALSLNCLSGPFHQTYLLSSSFLDHVIAARKDMLQIFSPVKKNVFKRILYNLKSKLQSFSHYDENFLFYRDKITASGLMNDKGAVVWLQLLSKLADLLDDIDKRFWNQLAIDAQLQSRQFADHFYSGQSLPPVSNWKRIDQAIAKATAKFGMSLNKNDDLGIPIKSVWRSRTDKDVPGWQTSPISLEITATGFRALPEASHEGAIPLIIEEDIWAILVLAVIELKSGKTPSFSLEPFQESPAPVLPWKLCIKEFEPKWLGATNLGATMYYCDVLHLQDHHGRSVFSETNPRISSEYLPDWKLEYPWDTSLIPGASAWDAQSSRSAITLSSITDPIPAIIEDNSVRINLGGIPTMKFDASEIAWRNGDYDRRVGYENPRFRCIRQAAYMDKHFAVYAEQYPVFQRLACLQGIYAEVCMALEDAPPALLESLSRILHEKRAEFAAQADQDLLHNPNNVAFDIR